MMSLISNIPKITKAHLFSLGILAAYLFLFVGQSAKEGWVWPAVMVSILVVGGLMITMSVFRNLISPLDQKKQNLKAVLYFIIYFSLALVAFASTSIIFTNLLLYEYLLLGFACMLLAVRVLIVFTDFSTYTTDLFENVRQMVTDNLESRWLYFAVTVTCLLCLLHATLIISDVVLISGSFIITEYTSRVAVRASH